VSLDIRVQTKKRHADSALTIALEDDANYWFLHPLFERLEKECGKYIDLYGDTSFTRDDFPRLRKILEEAAGLAKQQPKTWNVQVGTALPGGKAILRPAGRDEVLAIIATFRKMIDVAETTGGYIECIGD
jgi:hypothetical protein